MVLQTFLALLLGQNCRWGIGSIKALTTAFIVSTTFGTAIFGLLIDYDFSIENIALISGLYILISTTLLIMMKNTRAN